MSLQTTSWQLQINRCYSAKQPLTLKLIEERVVLVLNLYDKIAPEKVRFALLPAKCPAMIEIFRLILPEEMYNFCFNCFFFRVRCARARLVEIGLTLYQ